LAGIIKRAPDNGYLRHGGLGYSWVVPFPPPKWRAPAPPDAIRAGLFHDRVPAIPSAFVIRGSSRTRTYYAGAKAGIRLNPHGSPARKRALHVSVDSNSGRGVMGQCRGRGRCGKRNAMRLDITSLRNAVRRLRERLACYDRKAADVKTRRDLANVE